MEKMWAGRFEQALDKIADDFNSSIHFDCKMYKQDITGSMKHAAMLAMQGIISDDDCDQITAGLQSILDDLNSGDFALGQNGGVLDDHTSSVDTGAVGVGGETVVDLLVVNSQGRILNGQSGGGVNGTAVVPGANTQTGSCSGFNVHYRIADDDAG